MHFSYATKYRWVMLKFLYHDILRKNIVILHIQQYFLYSMRLKYMLHCIIFNKEIPNINDLYLKIKSKNGPLVGYKCYQKFDDFYSSLCKKLICTSSTYISICKCLLLLYVTQSLQSFFFIFHADTMQLHTTTLHFI